MENFFYIDHLSIAFDDSVYIERFTRISTSYRTRVFRADNPRNSPNISIICWMHGRENSRVEETTQSFFHRRYSRFCFCNCVSFCDTVSVYTLFPRFSTTLSLLFFTALCKWSVPSRVNIVALLDLEDQVVSVVVSPLFRTMAAYFIGESKCCFGNRQTGTGTIIGAALVIK